MPIKSMVHTLYYLKLKEHAWWRRHIMIGHAKYVRTLSIVLQIIRFIEHIWLKFRFEER